MGSERQAKGGWKWIALVFVLIGANMTICAVTVVAARSSQPPIVKDYDAKALRWDDSAAQRATNRVLGWRMMAAAEHRADGGTDLNVRLLDSSGRGIRTARVVASVCAESSSQRREVVMTSDDAGRYSAEMPHGAAGWWDVQIAAEAGGMTFCEQTRVLVNAGTLAAESAVRR
jgi:nitrogen fixation protein FixH